jgi:hypothetical protein
MVAVAVVAALVPAARAAASLDTKWAAVPELPKPVGANGVQVRDIAAISSADVWAVGTWSNTSTHPLAAHWDGTIWKVVQTPDAGNGLDRYELTAADGTASGDVWAVGDAQLVSAGSKDVTITNLVMHYDGRAWAVVPSPSRQSTGATNVLTDIDMLSAGNGWAVGRAVVSPGPARATIMHWSSGQWVDSAVPPIDASSTELTSVRAVSTNDVWAVGSQLRNDGKRASLVLHWDGAGWQQVTVPDAGAAAENETLASVAARTSTDVWAVGSTCKPVSQPGACRPLVLRLFGGGWRVVPTAGDGTELKAVIPLSTADVWVVGYAIGVETETDHAEHWDGQHFTTDTAVPVTTPEGNGEAASALVTATLAPDTGAIWAAGWARDPTSGLAHVIRRG